MDNFALLRATFGDIAVYEARLAPVTEHTRQRALAVFASTRSAIVNCEDCPLSRRQTPVPFRGPPNAQWAIMGEAPGTREQWQQRPFVGPAGKRLAKMLAAAGLMESRGLFMNTVSCAPGGAPERAAIAACAHHRHAQLQVANTPYVILAGQVALNTVRRDLSITRARGAFIFDRGVAWFPILHPAYIIRSGDDHDEELTVDDLTNFRSVVTGEAPPTMWMQQRCPCGSYETPCGPDENGISYCSERHQRAKMRGVD